MGDPIVERLTAVEVGLDSLGKTVDDGFMAFADRMTRFEDFLMAQQQAIGESKGRMNSVHANRSNTHRELNRVWEFVKLPFVGVIGGLTVKAIDLLTK